MIKAIETRYNGYKFRSRLEARWAVFFDALGIEYQYEPEGFDLGEAGWYLPDFWLPQVNMWAEVKAGTFTWEELHKCAVLQDQSEHYCLLLEGIPDYRSYFCAPGPGWFSTMDGKDVLYDDGDSGYPGGDYEPILRDICNEPKENQYDNVDDFIIGPVYLDESRFYSSTGTGYPEPCTERDFIEAHCGPGVRAARGARFEHGETPKGPRV